jgi:RNA polymerase sigma-70 factor (ECF subfamily)
MSAATTFLALTRSETRDERVRAVVDAHYDSLWRFLRRLGVPESQAEDAVQQVLMVFVRRAPAVAAEVDRAFVFGTALRVASDIRRRIDRAREVPDGEALVDHPHSGPDAEQHLGRVERLRCLDRVLDTLAPDLRTTFVLAEIEEMTMAEISELVGVPAGTVASRLRRARELFERAAAAMKASLDAEGGA